MLVRTPGLTAAHLFACMPDGQWPAGLEKPDTGLSTRTCAGARPTTAGSCSVWMPISPAWRDGGDARRAGRRTGHDPRVGEIPRKTSILTLTINTLHDRHRPRCGLGPGLRHWTTNTKCC